MKYKFIHIETDLQGKETGKVLSMEFSADSLDNVLENFEYFLRGSGFHIDGTLEVVNDEPEGDEYSINLTDDNIIHSSHYYDYDRNRSPEQMNLDFGEAQSTLLVNAFGQGLDTSNDMFQDDLNGR